MNLFSLGAILFNLETGFPGFLNPNRSDAYYNYIINNDSDNYWKIFNCLNIKYSNEFKELYLKMVSYKPSNRPSIAQILESKWMQEINNLNEIEKIKLETEVTKIFDSLYKTLQEENEIKIAQEYELAGYNTKGFSNKNKRFINNDLKPTKISNETINFNNYIIMKGYLDPIDFMNSLVNEIEINFHMNSPSFKYSEKNLKFQVTFEIENNDDNEEIMMQIELFKYEDERYLLEFIKFEGEFSHYYNKFLEIKKIIKDKILNN